VCTCDDVLYLCAFTLDRHTICVAVVSRVREKEMQMATCKYSRGKFKESDILPFAFLVLDVEVAPGPASLVAS
jgi:hypothetical protein